MGGLDRFVIAEAPKSLRYRLEYWQGTWGVLQQHPWWGIGPGNFRSHYLQYKLAQSSEEISDPHNLLLDTWVNGGIIALFGLIAIGVLAVIAYFKGKDAITVVQDTPLDRSGHSPSTAGRIVIPLPHPVVMGTAGSLLLGLILDPGVQMVGLAVMWSTVLPLLSSIVGQVSIRPATFCLGIAVLAIHLLGAGGIGMPAICQTLLLLVVLMTPSIAQDASPRGHSQLPLIAVVAVAIGLFVGCWRVGLGPVRSRTEAIAEGDYFALQRGNLNKAEDFYRRAAQFDPWSSEPWRKLSVLQMGRWLASTDEAGDDELTAAIASMEKAIEKNPRSWTDFRTLGEYHLRGFSRTRDPEDARTAVAMYRTAVDLYPNDAELRAGLAVAFARAEKPAESRREALRAMELNIITTNAGHIDRVLPEKTLELIQKLAESGRFPDAGTDSD